MGTKFVKRYIFNEKSDFGYRILESKLDARSEDGSCSQSFEVIRSHPVPDTKFVSSARFDCTPLFRRVSSEPTRFQSVRFTLAAHLAGRMRSNQFILVV